jgi:hypothetical protein
MWKRSVLRVRNYENRLGTFYQVPVWIRRNLLFAIDL